MKINAITIKTLVTQLGDLESVCIDHNPSLCYSGDHLWFLDLRLILEINHLIPLNN